jgi:hypothetical protein
MFLDDKDERGFFLTFRSFAGRLGRDAEVALLGIFLECHSLVLARA